MPTKNEIAATMTKAEAARHGALTFTDVQEVAEVITANARKMFGFTRKQLPTGLPTEPKLFIFSVSEYGEDVNLGPGFPCFKVHPSPVGEDYGEPCIINPIYFMEEAKVDVTEHTFHSGPQIVDAILKLGPGMNGTLDRRKMGWFVTTTNPPSNKEIDDAVALYTAECQRLLREGNSYASRNMLLEINETHRRAAKFLRQKVDWEKSTQKMVDCPGCGEPVKEGVIWHATPVGCGYVFDMAEFNKRFPHNPLAAPHQTQQPAPNK